MRPMRPRRRARRGSPRCSAQGRRSSDSLRLRLRIPERSLAVAHGLTRRAQAGAAAHCAIPENAGHTVRDYVAQWQGEAFPLPAPWETLLEIQLNPRLSDEERSCGVELDIQLNPLNVRLMFVPAERTDAARLFGLGLSPIPCNARPCGNGAVGIRVPAAQASAVAAVLDQPTIEGADPRRRDLRDGAAALLRRARLLRAAGRGGRARRHRVRSGPARQLPRRRLPVPAAHDRGRELHLRRLPAGRRERRRDRDRLGPLGRRLGRDALRHRHARARASASASAAPRPSPAS